MQLKPEGCQEWIYGDYRGHQCNRKITCTRDGKNYCTIHDPQYIKEKHRKQEEERGRERAIKQKQNALFAARLAATSGLTMEELQSVTPAMIKALPYLTGQLSTSIEALRLALQVIDEGQPNTAREYVCAVIAGSQQAIALAEGGE